MRVARALFPISLSNQNFSSRRVIPALANLQGQYGEILFLVADRLQDYNRALVLAKGAGRASSGDEGSRGWLKPVDSFTERRRWLERVLSRVASAQRDFRWKILSVDSIADATAFQVMRRVDILYAVDRDFRSDVDRTVRQFVMRHPAGLGEAAEILSRRYVLEELALSVRIKTMRRCHDEFYLGKTLLPALKLFQGLYQASAWQLAGLADGPQKFRFFELMEDARGEALWRPATHSM